MHARTLQHELQELARTRWSQPQHRYAAAHNSDDDVALQAHTPVIEAAERLLQSGRRLRSTPALSQAQNAIARASGGGFETARQEDRIVIRIRWHTERSYSDQKPGTDMIRCTPCGGVSVALCKARAEDPR